MDAAVEQRRPSLEHVNVTEPGRAQHLNNNLLLDCGQRCGMRFDWHPTAC